MIKKILKKSLDSFGLEVQRSTDRIIQVHQENMIGMFKRAFEHLTGGQESNNEVINFCNYVITSSGKTHSQLFQDYAYLYHCNKNMSPNNGIFVEVGVGNGTDHSNSLFLENHLKMDGLLIEPDPRQAESIKRNRTARYAGVAVSETVGTITFHMASTPELSWVGSEKPDDGLDRNAVQSKTVPSMPLDDILEKNLNHEESIEYLSIDVEGGELNVLKGFTYSKWKPKFITIEHNRVDDIKKAMSDFFCDDYKIVLSELSDCDMWLLRKDLCK
jgi:FkbM family methyltransferase